MGITNVIAAAPAGLNKGQLFTTSGSWTVPAGVTFAYVIVRGGDGAPINWNNSAPVTLNGAAGGTSTALAVSAAGGPGGHMQNNGSNVAVMRAAMSGVEVAAIKDTTPGASETITVGSGTGAFVSIMWSE